MATVLIADDDVRVVDALFAHLSDLGHTVATAHDGPTAVARAQARLPDLAVIDLGLLGENGPTLADIVACSPELHFVALADDQRQLGRVGEGVDLVDFVVRPFSLRELVARVQAALRGLVLADDGLIRVGDVIIDSPARSVTVEDRVVSLTTTEYELIHQLARHAGRVLTREQLLASLQGRVADAGSTRAIDAHVKNIRRKIEPDPRRPRYLLTAHGAGYRFAED
ncbi:MAG: response regulator transcription factor [Actinomycetota bacterium]|nr:response regulator transcription factor [Actinomycetota bacterium]